MIQTQNQIVGFLLDGLYYAYLSLDKNIGTIEINKNADFLVLDENYNLIETYINGKRYFNKYC